MKHQWRLLTAGVVTLAVATTLGFVGVGVGSASADGDRPSACEEPDPDEPPQEPIPATLSTFEQAYYCIFDNYYSGPVLDSRTLLVPAFAAVARELQRRDLDQADATLPELSGDQDADMAAFGEVYQRIAKKLPAKARHAIAEKAIQAMVDALGDNHVHWTKRFLEQPTGFGWSVSAAPGPGRADPAAKPPTYVNGIVPDAPADDAGVKLGDEILKADGAPLYVDGIVNEGVLSKLFSDTEGKTVRFTVHRPANGRTFTVSITSGAYQPQTPKVTSELVDGHVAKVTLPAFDTKLVGQALKAIDDMRKKTKLRGVVLDLRNNGGGSPEAQEKLLGVLTHDKTISYSCDAQDTCTPNRIGHSEKLLRLPVAVLTERRCASACDAFSTVVKDLRLGTLVGGRTAGAVSGSARTFVLENHTAISLPKYHVLGANKEVVDTIGVAPDHSVPATAKDLSTGRDPALAKAISLL